MNKTAKTIIQNRRLSATFCLLLILSLLPPLAVAKTVVAQGQAVIEDDNIIAARARAYEEALRQAALTTGVQVYSRTAMDTAGNINDSLQLRTTQYIDSSEIIRESIIGNIITVTVEAQIGSDNEACDFPAANYRKKIAATRFSVLHPEHIGITDFYGFETGIGAYILQLLKQSDNFVTRNASHLTLYNDPTQAPYIAQQTIAENTLLTEIAENTGVQYVISGVIRDLSVELESDRLGVPAQGMPDLSEYFPSIKSFLGYQRRARKRHLSIEFYLHDTLTGELLSQNHYAQTIEDYYAIPDQAIPFGSQHFFQTRFGQLFDEIIRKETAHIQKVLNCRPFTMRVIDEKDGKLYLDAGTSNRVRAGDILTIYIPDKPGEIFGVKGKSDQFGMPKTTIRIEKVYPAYAVGVPENGYISQQDITNGYLLAW